MCQSMQWSQTQIRRLAEHLSQDRAKAAHKSLCCHKNTNFKSVRTDFYALLTVHLSIFILVINQLDAQKFVLQ